MNDTTNTATAKATRERQFGRVYDYEKGTVTITAAFDKDFTKTLALSAIPANVLEGFALQSIADYAVQEMNETLKDETVGDEAARRAAALKVFDEANAELTEGKIDFRTGVGLGGMRSAIGIMGTVLFELGKSYVLNQRGEKLSFTDIHSARAAVKSLYLDTTPKGPFKDKLDDKGQPVKDKEGKVIQVPVNPDSGLTGRMIFNAIGTVPEVKAAMDAKRTAKPKKVIEVQMG
jgi:hypothetical protein